MKKTIIMALLVAASVSASAQQKQTIEIPSWLSNVKLSGYGMTQYQYSGQKDAESNSFNIRMARISLEGRIAGDFYWKTQIQFNGNTSTLGSSPRMVDLFAEWQKYEYFKVKIGQFKNPFTFENPMHPIDQGFMGYSQNVSKAWLVSATVPVSMHPTAVTSVFSSRAISSRMPTAETYCTIRLVYSTDREPIPRTLTSRRM